MVTRQNAIQNQLFKLAKSTNGDRQNAIQNQLFNLAKLTNGDRKLGGTETQFADLDSMQLKNKSFSTFRQ